jgi:site-specific recombinase
MSREGRKKRGLSSDECEDTNLRDMNMLKSQLQAQNTNCKLDREQRTDHNDSLVSALNKLTDALVKIADNGSEQGDVYEASYIVNEHHDIC